MQTGTSARTDPKKTLNSLISLSSGLQKPRVWFLLSQAVPMMLHFSMIHLSSMIDFYLVRDLGENSSAAIMMANFLMMLFVSVALAGGFGVRVLVGKWLALEESPTPLTPIVISIVCVSFYAFLLVWGLPFIYDIYFHIYHEVSAPIRQSFIEYMDVRIWHIALIGFNSAFSNYFYGTLRSSLNLKIVSVIYGSNVLFTILLIPVYGIAGAAFGTVIGAVFGVLLFLYYFAKEPISRQMPSMQQVIHVFKSWFKIVGPFFLMQLSFAAFFMVLKKLFVLMGDTDAKASLLLINLISLVFYPLSALGMTVGSFMNSLLEGRHIREAHIWFKTSFMVSFCLVLPLLLLFALYPSFIMAQFIQGQHIIDAGSVGLQIVALALVADVIAILLRSVINGVGRTSATLKINLWMQWIILLPAMGLVVYLELGTSWLFGVVSIVRIIALLPLAIEYKKIYKTYYQTM